MDNVIWIILASAVFIALAGILLTIGGAEIGDLGSEADRIEDADWTSYEGFKEIDPEKFELKPVNENIYANSVQEFSVI